MSKKDVTKKSKGDKTFRTGHTPVTQVVTLSALPPTKQQHRNAEMAIEQTRAALHQQCSETNGFGLCEFVPKRTWVIGESYIHPQWYLRQTRRSKKERVRPWQTTSILNRWRAKDQHAELVRKTSSDLLFEDLNDERLDDAKQFDFEAAVGKKENKEARRKKPERDPHLQFHNAVPGSVPKDDPHLFYQRPSQVLADEINLPSDIGSAVVPVTLKAVMVDGKPAAFLACSFDGKAGRTARDVFDMFQDILVASKTLLPRGTFRIVPPKGTKWTVLYLKGSKPIGTAKKSSRKKKKKNAGKVKTAEKSSSAALTRSTPRSRLPTKTRHALSVSFGDPSEPLEFADDLLSLTELPDSDRNVWAARLQHREATNAREARDISRWTDLSKNLWRRKREKRLISQYLCKIPSPKLIGKHRTKAQTPDIPMPDSDSSDQSDIDESDKVCTLEIFASTEDSDVDAVPLPKPEIQDLLPSAHLPFVERLGPAQSGECSHTVRTDFQTLSRLQLEPRNFTHASDAKDAPSRGARISNWEDESAETDEDSLSCIYPRQLHVTSHKRDGHALQTLTGKNRFALPAHFLDKFTEKAGQLGLHNVDRTRKDYAGKFFSSVVSHKTEKAGFRQARQRTSRPSKPRPVNVNCQLDMVVISTGESVPDCEMAAGTGLKKSGRRSLSNLLTADCLTCMADV